MAANELSFNQVATILNAVSSQALGAEQITPTDTSSFITLATTTLKAGYDPILRAISCVLTDTIFSVRPYAAKFRIMTRDASTYGMHSRKINYMDNPVVDDPAYDPTALADGQSVDMYKVRKPKVVQTNYYGENAFADYVTIFENQIDVAFRGYEEFRDFISGVLDSIDAKISQAFEAMNRMCALNLAAGIMAKYDGQDTPQIVHLITEYKAETGNDTITSSNYKSEDEFPYFAKWVVAKIETKSNLLTERSIIFHTNFTNASLPRHTPKNLQKALFLSEPLTFMRTNMLADAFNEGDLKLIDHELVNYWQSINDPATIDITPSYVDDDGEIVNAESAVESTALFGMLFDIEAAGHTIFNQRLDATPLNSAGLFVNLWWNYLSRWWNDFSEKCVIFLLD